MQILKFKILVEELDNVYRDMEIKSGQTFKDFNDAIIKFFNIRSKKHASFFTSNTRWQKLIEITLGQSSLQDNPMDGLTTTIGQVVNEKDDLDRLIYFNEGLPQFTFLVEWEDIHKENSHDKHEYPRLVKSGGNLSTASTPFMDEAFDENAKLNVDEIIDDDVEDSFENRSFFH